MLHDNDTPEKISNNNVLHNLYLTTQKNEEECHYYLFSFFQ
jgi:hypothetical protein